MLRITERIIRTALREDATITKKQQEMALAILKGKFREPRVVDSEYGKQKLLLTQSEAASLLSVSRFTIRRMEQEGALHRVTRSPSANKRGGRLERCRWAEIQATVSGEAPVTRGTDPLLL